MPTMGKVGRLNRFHKLASKGRRGNEEAFMLTPPGKLLAFVAALAVIAFPVQSRS